MSFQSFQNNLINSQNLYNTSFHYYYQNLNRNTNFSIQNNNVPHNKTLKYLQNIRIIKKNLVYLIGLSKSLISLENKLKSYEYLGQYGLIEKFVINKLKTYNSTNPNGPSYSCHITFSNSSESSLAILALDNIEIDNHIIKASYGTTKYCLNYLKNNSCNNKYCLYLHGRVNNDDLISREEMNNNKSLFERQHILAINLSGILDKDFKEKIKNNNNMNTIFPNILSIYNKDFVKQYLTSYRIKEINEITLNEIFSSKNKSRFSFALENKRDPANNNEYKDSINVPLNIQNFINNNIRDLLLNNNECKPKNYYLNSEFNFKDDSWLSFENKLQKFKIYDENDIEINKFYTY